MSETTNNDLTVARKSAARIRTVKQLLNDPDYSWVTNSYIRHVIFQAEDRYAAGGVKVSGNGLAPAIIRLGRKILIDMDLFDEWVEDHRMANLAPD